MTEESKTKLREKILRSKELTAMEKRYLENLIERDTTESFETTMCEMTVQEISGLTHMPIFSMKCFNCGAMCFDDDTYCSNCGARFDDF